MPSFREWFPLIAQPPLRTGPNGPRYFGELGGAMDDAVQRIREAALLDVPAAVKRAGASPTIPPTDAIDELGKDRMIERGAGPESDAAYVARLANAWELWGGDAVKGGGGGTPRGIMLALKAAGFPMGSTGAHSIQYNGRWARINGTDDLEFGSLMTCVNRPNLLGSMFTPGPGWMFDGPDKHWSSFGIVFPADVVGLDNTDGNLKKALLNNAVKKWKPDFVLYRGAWVFPGSNKGLGWPLARTLSSGETLGGNTIRYIAPE